jgi:predicted dehydrogenase
MRKVRWGVISTGNIGVQKVIPAMQRGKLCEFVAMSSRDRGKAEAAAARLGIPRAHGSYEALLADPDVEAVYITTPNHLHVPWSIKALEAGKHVLCEKPIGLDAAEAETLAAAAARHPSLKIMEAFMYRHHPQWRIALEMARGGRIGDVRTVHSIFSYRNMDPDNVRNRKDIGGGGLMDIGCYNISLSRLLFDAEPTRVLGVAEIDPTFGTDVLTSGVLQFPRGTATFTCSTQIAGYQRVHVFGTEGRIELEIPFNAPHDAAHRLWLYRGQDVETIEVGYHDQYQIQGDLMSRAILDDTPVPTPLTDAMANMKVIDAIVESAATSRWIS